MSLPPAQAATTWLVVFLVDEHRLAVPLAIVERIVRSVAVTALPDAPAVVAGVIDVGGQVLPVFDVRQRFRLPQRSVSAADHLLIARTARRTVALLIDAAEAVVERAGSDIICADSVVSDLGHIQGLARLDDGLVLIQDLEQFLSAEEAQMLDLALEAQRGG